jgi:hypothetical protein
MNTARYRAALAALLGVLLLFHEVRAVADSRPEVLVLLRQGAGEAPLAELRRRFTILSLKPPRLVVLAIGADRVAEVQAIHGVEAVFTAAVPGTVLDALAPGERLFAEAWSMRQQPTPKRRPGDGLPWDAPGFLPPDKPPDR